MANLSKKFVPGDKSLELTMRDAQLGLMDAASYFAFAPGAINFEILSLEPPCQPPATLSTHTDNVVKMTMARSHDVVNFLIRPKPSSNKT